MSKIQPLKSLHDLPVTMTAKDVASVLNISLTMAYRIMRIKDFPTLCIGDRKLVNRERFLAWLENQDLPLL